MDKCVFSAGENTHGTVFQEVMKLLGITHIVTPPYSSEGDKVERTHLVIQSCMRSDDRFPEKDWPRRWRQHRQRGTFPHTESQNGSDFSFRNHKICHNLFRN